MGFDIGSVATGTANTAIGAIAGLALGNHNDKRQYRQQEKLQALQIQGNKEMSDYNYAKQLQMWKDTNYKAQVDELNKAGLNVGMMYGMSGGGGTTTGSGGGQVQGASAPTGGGEVPAMVSQGMQLSLLDAQRKVLESQANLNNVEATKKSGVDTENVKADTANKIADQVIKEFTGKESKDQYEKVKMPNRSIEAKTWEDELSARQGVATVLYDMWQQGKLEQKSLAEVEQATLQNAKTRAETKNIGKAFDILEQNLKGATLDNTIKELETKLQTQTGIDSKSPTWLKVMGRLFIKLMGE